MHARKSKATIANPIQVDIETIPPGKIRCYITGQLRNDSSEEHVRQRTARSLVEEYGYEKGDIELERVIRLGRAKKKADIVIFRAGANHSSEEIEIIVEAKKDTIKPNSRENGVDQLQSYMSGTPNCKFGLWVGSEAQAYQKVTKAGRIRFEDVLDIPIVGRALAATRSFADLVPATENLTEVFKRCHSYIAANQGGSKEFAFQEFLKITFCKVFDERYSARPRFYIDPLEHSGTKGRNVVLRRIEGLFEDVCKKYGYIFGRSEKLELKAPVVSYIVAELQKYSLLDTDFDYKGQAYEEIVGANSRGERGEFFTPRNLCQLAVDMVLAISGEERLGDFRVLDPACGTGGFLRTYVHRLSEWAVKREIAKWGDTEKARDKAKDLVKQLCDNQVFGIDFNAVLVRAAQMNLVMHGDGSSNVFHENALLSWGEWGPKVQSSIRDAQFDLIITNPPFGEDLVVDDAHVLNQYELSRFGSKAQRTSMVPQELFLERCHRLLRDNGLLAVVTPDNLLSNPSYIFIRDWLLLRFVVIASVSLPQEMFQPSTGTQTSLMVLRKRRSAYQSLGGLPASERKRNVFLAVPQRIGHDQRGAPIPLRDEDGEIVVRKVERTRIFRDASGKLTTELLTAVEPIMNDQLPQVLTEFAEWLRENNVA